MCTTICHWCKLLHMKVLVKVYGGYYTDWMQTDSRMCLNLNDIFFPLCTSFSQTTDTKYLKKKRYSKWGIVLRAKSLRGTMVDPRWLGHLELSPALLGCSFSTEVSSKAIGYSLLICIKQQILRGGTNKKGNWHEPLPLFPFPCPLVSPYFPTFFCSLLLPPKGRMQEKEKEYRSAG